MQSRFTDPQIIRDCDGSPVVFRRIAPGGFVVVDIDGRESLVTRKRWQSLPVWGAAAMAGRRTVGKVSREAWTIAALFMMLCICTCISSLTRVIASLFRPVSRALRAAVQTERRVVPLSQIEARTPER
jgi:hypothetical protein